MIGRRKKCIGIVFGGNSNEHYVSISAAKTETGIVIAIIAKIFMAEKNFLNIHYVVNKL